MSQKFLLPGGALAALVAAALFGAGTPASKWLLDSISPWLMAGLLYLGCGLGLTLYRLLTRPPAVSMAPAEWGWLIAAVLAGGVAGPVLLMFGLTGMPAASTALLLNAESVFTALLAWVFFHENVDRRIALGMLSIVAGAVLLSWPAHLQFSSLWPSLCVLGACLAWGVDNNLTRKIALSDASFIAAVKGWVAGIINVLLAVIIGTSMPPVHAMLGALVVGSLAYGASLALFVVALRDLGTARTGAYFSVAPFFGAVLAVLWLREPFNGHLIFAGALMAFGVWLHLTEKHSHPHTHESLLHDHWHVHDEHHQHEHDYPVAQGVRHKHVHQHAPLTHSHRHFPDTHHRHRH